MARWFYKYGAENWAQLLVDQDSFDEPLERIDAATTIRITVAETYPWAFLEAGQNASEAAYDEDNANLPFMKFVYCPDDVESTDLDTDVDDVIKLWMGKLVSFTMSKGSTVFEIEQYQAQLLRELNPVDSNLVGDAFTDADDTGIVEEVQDVDQLSCVESDGSTAITWDADEHNGRGVRITAKATEASERVFASSFDWTKTGGSEVAYGSAGDEQTDDGTYFGYSCGDASGPAYDDCHVYVDCTFPVRRCPSSKFKLHADFNMSGSYLSSGGQKIQIYNFVTDAWSDLLVQSGVVMWGTKIVDIDIEDANLAHYDHVNEIIKIRFDGGLASGAGATLSRVSFDFLYLEVAVGFQHDPVELQIADTQNDDELVLTVDSGVHDLHTMHVNDGDTIEIVQHDEEWLEDVVSALGVDIDSIAAPSSSAATYSRVNYKSVHLDTREICERNAWYAWLGRTTSSGKAILTFSSRSDPPEHGLLIDDSCVVNDDVVVRVNALEKFRQVICINKSTTGRYPDAPALSNYPPARAARGDLPTAYLVSHATAMYNQRSALRKVIDARIAYVKCCDEHFQWYDVTDQIRGLTLPSGSTWNAWVTGGGNFVVAAVNGRKVGRITDTGAGVVPKLEFTSHAMAAGEFVSIETRHTTLDSAQIAIGAAITLEYTSSGIELVGSSVPLVESFEEDSVGNPITNGTNLIGVTVPLGAITMYGTSTVVKVVSGSDHYAHITDTGGGAAGGMVITFTNTHATGAGVTLEFYVYAVNDQLDYFIINDDGGDNRITVYRHTTGDVMAFYDGSGVRMTATSFPSGQWVKVTLEFISDTRFKCWIDDVACTYSGSAELTTVSSFGGNDVGGVRISGDTPGTQQMYVNRIQNSWDSEAGANTVLFAETDGDLKIENIDGSTINAYLDDVASAENPITAGMGSVAYVEITSGGGEFDVYSICRSWVNQGKFLVHEASPSVFHAGANVRALLCKDASGDFLVNDEFVLRELKWGHDEHALLSLGFSDADEQSEDAIFRENIARSRHEVAT